jgi:uncharacterized damage-inducible protein DinB
MGFADVLLPEFDLEMTTTRRVLERVPYEKATWKPHEKSFALGHLAQLVAGIPGWIPRTLRDSKIDLAASPGYSFEQTPALLDTFDKNVSSARAAIVAVTDAELETDWQLVRGDMVLWTTPRHVAVRSHVNHLIHHRGQLTVYLRLIDVPIPPIYGPTADEQPTQGPN